MNRKINPISHIIILLILFTACATTRHYDFSLNNTLSIFFLKSDKNYYFCIPVQYMGGYQINNFEFVNGSLTIGDYEISLKRDEVKITVYLNETAEFEGNLDAGFNLIYLEEYNNILLSKMDEPLTNDHEVDDKYNHYYIFIERHLTEADVKKMVKEYEKDNTYCKFVIEYDITFDNELQAGSGLLDDFELYDGLAIDPVCFPGNLNFFKTKYMIK
jgi:hypothetical protein